MVYVNIPYNSRPALGYRSTYPHPKPLSASLSQREALPSLTARETSGHPPHPKPLSAPPPSHGHGPTPTRADASAAGQSFSAAVLVISPDSPGGPRARPRRRPRGRTRCAARSAARPRAAQVGGPGRARLARPSFWAGRGSHSTAPRAGLELAEEPGRWQWRRAGPARAQRLGRGRAERHRDSLSRTVRARPPADS
jgi:hypothetical protein